MMVGGRTEGGSRGELPRRALEPACHLSPAPCPHAQGPVTHKPVPLLPPLPLQAIGAEPVLVEQCKVRPLGEGVALCLWFLQSRLTVQEHMTQTGG